MAFNDPPSEDALLLLVAVPQRYLACSDSLETCPLGATYKPRRFDGKG